MQRALDVPYIANILLGERFPFKLLNLPRQALNKFTGIFAWYQRVVRRVEGSSRTSQYDPQITHVFDDNPRANGAKRRGEGY